VSLKILLEKEHPPTLALEGRLDSVTAPDLDRMLDRVLARKGIPRIVFDLGQLDYLSSAGIRCFVRARKAIEPNGGRIAIVNPKPAVQKVLDIVKAIPPGGLFKSVAELDAYLDDMQRKVREGESE
jgi:anti-sigma B factor antagonist